MNNWNVLIIDDEADEQGYLGTRREKIYKGFASGLYNSRGFTTIFAKNADDARVLLRKSVGIDFVLLDVRLGNWTNNDDAENTHLFEELFELADNKNYAVGLISGQWTAGTLKIVTEFHLRHPEIHTPLLFYTQDFADGNFERICRQIATYIEYKKQYKRKQHTLKLKPDTELRLLHISDLHFGTSDASASMLGLWNTKHLCDAIKREWGDDGERPAGPDLVAITGDIGNTGSPNDYKDALKWFEKFAKEFDWSLPNQKFLIVPGNHDFSISLCGAARLELESTQVEGNVNIKRELILSDKSCNDELASYAMLPFSEFATRVCGNRHLHAGYPLKWWTEYGFSEYGVVFSGINTSFQHNRDSRPSRKIDPDDIAAIQKKFEEYEYGNSGEPNLLHIILSHHPLIKHPNAREPIEDCENHSAQFNTLWSPKIFLCGHEHSRGGHISGADQNKKFIVTAPTTTTSPTTPSSQSVISCGVNLLELKRSRSMVSSVHGKSMVKVDNDWEVLPLRPNSTWER